MSRPRSRPNLAKSSRVAKAASSRGFAINSVWAPSHTCSQVGRVIRYSRPKLIVNGLRDQPAAFEIPELDFDVHHDPASR